MRLGLIARADNTGLGIQTWEFYRAMSPVKTMVVDIGDLNGNRSFPERYPRGATVVQGFPNKGDVEEFLQDLDCVFLAEAPYNYYLYERAKQLGVKVAVQYNYEFFDWFAYPHYPTPDMLIAPSRWGYSKVQEFCDQRGIKHQYLHCPVNRDMLPARKITKAKTFLHVAGRSAAYDRNGTETVIDASALVKSDVKIIVHFQGEQGLGHQATSSVARYMERAERVGGPGLVMRCGEYPDYWDIYKGHDEGDGVLKDQPDVFVLPRRYGGNCLPLNEALSCGMPIIMPDISPNNSFLPHDWLVPAEKIGEFKPRAVVDIYGCDPAALAAKIDEFANMTEDQMFAHNLIADRLAEKISWDTMRHEYVTALRALCGK